MIAVVIDVLGSFCARKFNEKVKQVYQRYELWKVRGAQASEKDITNDKHAFIRQVMSQLFVFKCVDVNEFNLTVRSLSAFFKQHKGIGLVVIDGMHFMENTDFMSHYEKKHQAKQNQVNQTMPSAKISSIEAFAGQDEIDTDNFFSTAVNRPQQGSDVNKSVDN